MMVLNIALDDKFIEDGDAYLHLPRMTTEEFYAFCQRNPTLNVERNAEGDVILMAPADSYGESRNAEIVTDLAIWNRQLPEPGLVFSSSAGFTLPNGAERAPDAAWIPKARWEAIPTADRFPFAKISPDFVVELMSPSDRFAASQRKMDEWMANGTRLGLLIDRAKKRVYVYREGQPEPDVLTEPTEISCDPVLPGFTLPLERAFA